MVFSFPKRKKKSGGNANNGTAKTYQTIATPSPIKAKNESAARKNRFNTGGVAVKNITPDKGTISSSIGGVNHCATGPAIVTPKNNNVETALDLEFDRSNQMRENNNISRSGTAVNESDIHEVRLKMGALFNSEDDEDDGHETGKSHDENDQANYVANEADTGAKADAKSPRNSAHDNTAEAGSARLLPKWISRMSGKKSRRGHSPQQEVKKRFDRQSRDSSRFHTEQKKQHGSVQQKNHKVPTFVDNIQEDELSIPSLITEPDEVPLNSQKSSSLIMIPVKPSNVKKINPQEGGTPVCRDDKADKNDGSDHTPPTAISPSSQEGKTPKRSGSRLSKYDENQTKDGVSPSSRGLNAADTSRPDSDSDEDIFDFSKVREFTTKTGLGSLWNMFQCKQDFTLSGCDTGPSRSCEPFIDFCGAMGEDAWGMDVKDEDERLAVHFLNESIKNGIKLIYHESLAGGIEWKESTVKLFVRPGNCHGMKLIHPRLVWASLSAKHGSQITQSSDDGAAIQWNSIILLDIFSILPADGSDGDNRTRLSPSRSNQSNEDLIHTSSESTGFFSVTASTGEVFVFEAPSWKSRDYTVRGLQKIISRLSFHMITGNVAVVSELFSEDAGQMTGELPSLVTPTKALNEVTHAFLDSL